jgi:hypothetical protein
MSRKLTVAIFDRDKVAEIGKYPVSPDGSKISIKRGGKKNFNPTFDNDSYLELKLPFMGKRKVYFVRRGAKACVNFKTEKVPDFDVDSVFEAAKAEVMTRFGTEKAETPYALYFVAFLQIILMIIFLSR